MPLMGFKFLVEQLSPEKREEAEGLNQVPTADDIGSLLFRTRDGSGIDTLTNAREHGIKWYPELQYSVVNVFADTWACICCRCPSLGCLMPVKCFGFHLYKLSLTRAQWLWAFNLVCFLAHLVMAYLCLTACGGDRFGTVVNSNCTASAMEVNIMRMSSNWTSGASDGYVLSLRDNGMPVRFDLIVAWFFLLSAIFHSFPVVFGPFDRFAWAYWKCIDSAFCYWRWIEYSASAPIMFMALQLTIGVREEAVLTLSWVLISLVMICGLATEAWSRPDKRDAEGYRGWVGDPVRTPEIMALMAKKRAWVNRNYIKRPSGTNSYDYDKTLEGLSARERFEYNNQNDPRPPIPLTFDERQTLRTYTWAYTQNYLYRLIPHFVGWVPYTVAWYCYFSHFLGQLNDLKQDDEALFDRVPDFVPFAVGATCIWFTSFTFVQWRYQYLSPDFYYKTEWIYSFLSAGSKITLGLLLYVSVLMYASFAEALNDTPANRASGRSNI